MPSNRYRQTFILNKALDKELENNQTSSFDKENKITTKSVGLNTTYLKKKKKTMENS